MPKIFSQSGDEIADIPVSEKQRGLLEADAEITVIFHTPQMLRGALGHHSGAFSLRKVEGRYVTQEPEAAKQYADMQKAIIFTRGDII